MKKLFYLLVVIILYGCKGDKKDILEKEQLTILNNSVKLSSIKDNIVKKGDIKSYNKLVSYYVRNQNSNHELLPYSMIMVEKYKYYRACSYIYVGMIITYNNGVFDEDYLVKLNPEAQKIILYYLNLGARNNIIECQIDLQYLYENGIGVEKNTKISDSLKMTINNKRNDD